MRRVPHATHQVTQTMAHVPRWICGVDRYSLERPKVSARRRPLAKTRNPPASAARPYRPLNSAMYGSRIVPVTDAPRPPGAPRIASGSSLTSIIVTPRRRWTRTRHDSRVVWLLEVGLDARPGVAAGNCQCCTHMGTIRAMSRTLTFDTLRHALGERSESRKTSFRDPGRRCAVHDAATAAAAQVTFSIPLTTARSRCSRWSR